MKVLGVLVACILLLPSTARAQWYAGTYIGANHNSPASITVDQSSAATSLVFHDVTFASQPFRFPLYWGARIGRLFGSHLGLEFEFLHLKVIAQTDRAFHTTGTLAGAPFDASPEMDTIVQRYNMTHGLNFLMGNVVLRLPMGGRVAGRPITLVARAGGGPTITGTDTQVGFVEVSHYEFAGFGGEASAGVDVPLAGAWSAIAEYKFTVANPHITIAGGTGHMTAVTSQVAFGLTLGFGG